MAPRLADGLLDRALGFRPGPDGLTQSGEDVGVTLVVAGWLVVLEALGQLVAVIEYVLDGARHDRYFRNLSRTGIACTTTGPVVASTTPTS